MGLLCDFFIAHRHEIDPALVASGPKPPTPTLQGKGIDNIKIATLTCILLNVDLNDDNAVSARIPNPEFTAGDEGPWVFPVPPTVTQHLAALNPSARKTVLDRWAQTEECRLDHWVAADYTDWFNALCDLAATAVTSNSSLWVWLSL